MLCFKKKKTLLWITVLLITVLLLKRAPGNNIHISTSSEYSIWSTCFVRTLLCSLARLLLLCYCYRYVVVYASMLCYAMVIRCPGV